MAGDLEHRFDDATSIPALHWRLEQLLDSGRAEHLDEVVPVLAEAERQARELGRWVAVRVAYESAPAFEPAMRTKPAPPTGTPFVAWDAFARRAATTPTSATTDAPRVEVARAPNVVPYPTAVEEVRRRIARGDLYQANVTERLVGHSRGSPASLYAAMVGAQSSGYGALIVDGPHAVVSASPELFFRWEGDTITCRPMKGTAPRRPRPDDDRRAGAALRSSTKDRAENVMIVDLLRNDLARLASPNRTRVPELFHLERYETVWQLTSTIEVDVRPGTTLLDVFGCLFPCGSVTGAPKIAAMAVIDELEREPRGVYCGAIGLLAPAGEEPRAVFSVPIRTAVIDGCAPRQRLTYGVGAGITWSSDAQAEDAEVTAKARVLHTHWPAFDLLETMRRDARGIRHLHLHLDRMEASADWFGIAFDRAGIEQAVGALPPAHVPHRLRLLLDHHGSLAIDDAPLEPAPDVVTLAIDDVPTPADELFCCHKTTARQRYEAARARHQHADDVVLVNERDRAIETTVANLAFSLDGRWWVPPLSDGGLPGVARQVALEQGTVAERSIAADSLHACDALAVLNDLRGWRSARLLPPTVARAAPRARRGR